MNILKAHHQWATRPADQRFQTIEALHESVRKRRSLCRSTDIGLNRVHADVDANTGKLIINSAIAPCEPNNWSLGQIATTLGAPSSYWPKLPPALVKDCINHHISKLGQQEQKFCVSESEDGSPSTLRAVTSTQYGRIWDVDVIESVKRLNERTGNKFHNPLAYAHKGDANGFKTIDVNKTEPSGLYASDRDCFIFLINGGSYLEAGNDRAKLHRGIIVWNSEVGAKTLGILTFLFNAVCGNHIIYGAQAVNQLLIRHTRNAQAKFDQEAAPALLDFVNASADKDERIIRRALAYALPRDNSKLDSDALNRLLAPFKFTKTEVVRAVEYARLEESKCETLWDLIQGFTAYARGFDYIDARVDLEKRAGNLLKLVDN